MFGEEFHINRARGGVLSLYLSLIEKEGGKGERKKRAREREMIKPVQNPNQMRR